MKNDPEVLKAVQKLIDHGYSPESVHSLMADLLAKKISKKNISKDNAYPRDKDEIISENDFKFIQDEFILFVGPIAPVVLEEEIENLGFDQKVFPKTKLPELLENITLDFKCSVQKKKIFIEKILKSTQTL